MLLKMYETKLASRQVPVSKRRIRWVTINSYSNVLVLIWYSYLIQKNFYVSFQPVFEICVYDSNEDIFVSRSIIENGAFEPKISMLLKHLLSAYFREAEDKTILLDIGANLGIHGLYAAKLGYHVWAVEPQITNLIKVWSDLCWKPCMV